MAAPAEKTDKNEYLLALKRAACRLAVILAKLALDIEADYNSEYCFDTAPRKTNLPRVCYIYQIFAHKNMIEPFFTAADASRYYRLLLTQMKCWMGQ